MKKILIVDDVHTIAEATAAVLAMLGYETCTAYNGREAVDAVEREQPDVVLLDLHMPILDGFDAAREIRAKHGAPQPLLIALSAVVPVCGEGVLPNCGFDHCMTKPADVERLVALIERSASER